MDFNSIRKEINSKNASVKELINDIFAKIDSKDPIINSYICTTKINAIAQAENIDKLIQNDEKLPPLAGMPIAIKDNICTKGIVTTCASKMLKKFVAPYESTASSKLWSSGGIFLGKTNLDEFAMGSSTETSFLVLPQIHGILIEFLEEVQEEVLLQLQLVYVRLLLALIQEAQ